MDTGLEVEPTNGHKVRAEFWRHTALWMLAGAVGALLSWNVYINDRISSIREEQIRNTHKIAEHSATLARIETSGTDDRFRRSNWLDAKALIDTRFTHLEQLCERCCNRPSLSGR